MRISCEILLTRLLERHLPVNADQVDGGALNGFRHEVIPMALITPGTARCEFDAGAVDNRLHIARAATEPVVGVVVGRLILGLLERLILDVEGEDRITPLAPGLAAARGLVIEHVRHSGVIPGKSFSQDATTEIRWVESNCDLAVVLA